MLRFVKTSWRRWGSSALRFPSLEDLQQARITPGIALSSVQAVVDMYEGMLRYEIKDGIFQALETGNQAF